MPLSDADIILQNDDVVCVPGLSGALFFSSDTCEVMVVGEVRTPGIVSFAPGEQRTVMRAIFKAGGFDKFAKQNKVRVIQYAKDKKRTDQILDATKIMDKGDLDSDIEIKPGDMIIVPQSTFKM